MTTMDQLPFDERVFWDTEFHCPPGGVPQPLSLVAIEAKSGRVHRLSRDDLLRMKALPFDTGRRTLSICYHASAEMGCALSLGWDLPQRVLDLCVEFKAILNPKPKKLKADLISCLEYYGVDHIESEEKEYYRGLAIEGRPLSPSEQVGMLRYCESDVVALQQLLPRMLPDILDRFGTPSLSLCHALERAWYMSAVAHMERRGVPIDTQLLHPIVEHWDAIKGHLIERVDPAFGVYRGATFCEDLFEQYLVRNGIPWPRLDSGALNMQAKTIHSQVKTWPQLYPLYELQHALNQLKLNELQVGRDGRNCCLLGAFNSKTGRTQPSSKRFIFGPAPWIRHNIGPESGMAIAYADYHAQEYGVAGALSGDPMMIRDYRQGDPYIRQAINLGLAPPDATRETHGGVRDIVKVISIATLYGQGAKGLAMRTGMSVVKAEDYLRRHRETYAVYWAWVRAVVTGGIFNGQLVTLFGWPRQVRNGDNARSLQNFPIQANGAEIMRLVCCLAIESGLELCCSVHDGFLLQAPIERIEDDARHLQEIMAKAARVVLGDALTLRSDVKIFRYPERYRDGRGQVMWATVLELLVTLQPDLSELVAAA